MKRKPIPSPYVQGYDACYLAMLVNMQTGKDLGLDSPEGCPFTNGSPEWADWMDGWRASARDLTRTKPK